MPNFTFNEEKHEGMFDGVVIPSVTQILQETGLTDFSKVDPGLLERNAAFGIAGHAAIQYKCKGTLDDSSVDETLKPYVAGWDNFVEDFGYVFHRAEVRGYHPVYRYTYGIDQLGEITNGKYIGNVVGDIKFGIVKPSDNIQLAGYKIAAGKDYKHIFILYLNPKFKPRGYKVVFATNNKKEQGIFLSCLSVFNYRKEKGLL